MKNIFLLIIFILGFQILSAQSCGNSGSGVCTSPGLLTEPGYEPYYLIPPITNDSIENTVIEIMGSDSLKAFNTDTVLIVDSVQIDSIYNLPEGLCWSTNKPTNTFYNRDDGCIKLTGTTCSPPGQYALHLLLNVYSAFPSAPFFTGPIILRVVNRGETPGAFDTSGYFWDSVPTFIPYGPTASCNLADIYNLQSNEIAVKAFPNPFNNVTHIVVTGLNEKFGFELYDVTGRLQQSIPSIDNNQFDVHKGQLSNGVYLYRILVSNKPAAYGKLVIE